MKWPIRKRVWRGAPVSSDQAAHVVSALYSIMNALSGLQPATRLIVLRAVCSVFLTDEPLPVVRQGGGT